MLSTDTAMKIIAMVEGCAVWAGIFIVVFLITRTAGMTSNLPREAKKRLATFSKYNDYFLEKVTDGRNDTKKTLIKRFKKHRHLLKDVTKLFAVYAYEHPFNVKSNAALKSFQKMGKESQQISAAISDGQFEKIEEHLRNIAETVVKTDSLLDEVIEMDNEERLMNS